MVFLYTSYTANRLVLKNEFLIKQKGTLGLFAPDPNQGPEGPQPQSSQVRLMRTLLVSVDLSTDRTSATGGCPCFVPGPATGDITLLGVSTTFACCVGGDDKYEGFWPKKAREHPRGKVNFPSRMIPWLSPDAKHPGWRLRRRARSTMAPSQTSAFLPISAGAKPIHQFKLYPLLRSRR